MDRLQKYVLRLEFKQLLEIYIDKIFIKKLDNLKNAFLISNIL